jgi:hypothetical protein
MSATDFEKEYIDNMIIAKELCDYFSYNTIEDPKFDIFWEKLEPNIHSAEIADSYLHRKQFKNMIDNVSDPDKLVVFWKKHFNDAKVGDAIKDGKVVGVFTLTIWIENSN